MIGKGRPGFSAPLEQADPRTRGGVMAGTWSNLGKQPGVSMDTMLLLTDGRVFCHEFQSNRWHTLTPSDAGDYGNGSEHSRADAGQHQHPEVVRRPDECADVFRSAVLADGRVFVAGGEYNLANSTSNDILAAQIFDPRTGHWTAISAPPGWDGIGDAVSCVLPDGRVMLGQYDGNAVALYNPDRDQWTFTSPKGDSCSEETFTLMPDNTVITVQCSNPDHSEKYDIATDQWVSAGTRRGR